LKYKKEQLEISALSALRKVLKNPQATWTSDAQKQGILASVRRDTDIFAIMATGSGKTMLPIIPAVLEESMITIVILPLKSLVTDYKRKLETMGIPYEHFKGSQSRSVSGRCNLVLVTIDVARTSHWKQCIGEINAKVPIGRIVVDEAHYAITSDDFRPALQNVYEVRIGPVPLIILSGTIPPRSEDPMKNAYGLSSNALVLRTSTDRPELEYLLRPRFSSNEAVLDETVNIVRAHQDCFAHRDRTLIYVPYLDNGIQIAKALGCEFYNGDRKSLSDEERENIYQRWISGSHKVMVCTSAFSAGNDYSHTRLVIHAGTPLEMIGFIQEMSRGGRDHRHARCYILPKSSNHPAPLPGDLKGVMDVHNLVHKNQQCIRFQITLFCDGKGILCKEQPGAYSCNYCRKKGKATERTSRKIETMSVVVLFILFMICNLVNRSAKQDETNIQSTSHHHQQ